MRDMNTVFRVHFPVDIAQLTADEQAKYCDLEDNVNRTLQFMAKKVNLSTEAKVKEGRLPKADPDDREATVKRGNYQAASLDLVLQKVSWIASGSPSLKTETISSEKKDFHQRIYETFTVGLNTGTKLTKALDDFLIQVNTSLERGSAVSTSQAFWIQLIVYRWDDQIKTPFATIRTIYFAVNQSLRDIPKSKGMSESDTVTISISYARTDGSFDNRQYVESVKESIRQFLGDETTNAIGEDIVIT